MGKSKTRIHCFINDIYPRRLFIVKGHNVDSEWLNDRFFVVENPNMIIDAGEDGKASVYDKTIGYRDDGKYGILIVINDKLTVSDIAHESVHAASFIFNDIGAYFDFENQEPFTYLVGWVADCINQVITNKIKD